MTEAEQEKEDGTTEMIRRAETPEDYFATIKGFNF